ncbi:MAG TPA: AMP-binding protein, partial [Chroococcales cyanobacterium]
MSLTITQNDVLSLMFDRSRKYRERAALSRCLNGSWLDLSFEEVQQRALRLSNFLIEHGIKRGDKVAILSESCPEWGIALFAAIRSGATVVPLDIKLTIKELGEIVSDCQPRAIFAGDELLQTAHQLQARNGCLQFVFALIGAGEGITAVEPDTIPAVEHVGCNRSAAETALIVYTSGTTTRPKGVMISFGTLIFQIERIEEALNAGAQDVFLSVLPMNHLLELTCGFLGPLYCGARVCFAQGLYPHQILSEIKEKQVTWMIAVPSLLNS